MEERWSVRRINALYDALPDVSIYLEIGVAKGNTFKYVNVPNRVGVDPAHELDTESLPAGVRIFTVTSDDFFASNNEAFDMVFIDGLHTYQQTYRDLVSALNVCPDGPILIDDVVPCDEVSAMPSMVESLAKRKDLNMPGQPWHGDVYRMVLCIADNHPELSYRTILNSGNPQMLLWKDQPVEVQAVADNVLSQYATVTYDDIFSNGVPELFKPSNENDALSDAITSLLK